MSKLKAHPSRVQAKEPGMGGFLWIADIEQFNVLQKPLPVFTGSTVGDEATITANHTFKTLAGFTTNGFIKIPLIPTNSGKYMSKREGDYPSKKTVSSFEGQATGLNAAQLEMLKRFKGLNLIVLVQDAECGNEKVYQIGCDCKPVDELAYEFDSETNIVKLTGSAQCDLAVYSGTIAIQTI